MPSIAQNAEDVVGEFWQILYIVGEIKPGGSPPQIFFACRGRVSLGGNEPGVYRLVRQAPVRVARYAIAASAIRPERVLPCCAA